MLVSKGLDKPSIQTVDLHCKLAPRHSNAVLMRGNGYSRQGLFQFS